MSKQRVKVVEKTKNLSGESRRDLSDALNYVLMGDLVDLSIAWPKYLQFREIVQEYVLLTTEILGSPLLDRRELARARPSLERHLSEINDMIASHMSMDLSDYVGSWNLIEKPMHTEFHKIYNELKKHRVLRGMFASLAQIVDYKDNFNDTTGRSLQSRLGFITSMPGNTWMPLPYELDFGVIMTISGIGNNTHKWILDVLSSYNRIVKSIWNLTQSPDVDVDEFVKSLEGSLDSLTSIPELSRCKAAFGLIKSSLGMLRDNFGAYYKNFVDTNDPNTILHEFVVDVTNVSGKTQSPQVSSQIRTIIKFFHKQAALRASSPNADAKSVAMMKKMETIANGLFGSTPDESGDTAAVDDKLSKSARADAIAEAAQSAPQRAGRATRVRSSAAAAAAAPPREERPTDSMTAEELEAYING